MTSQNINDQLRELEQRLERIEKLLEQVIEVLGYARDPDYDLPI